MINSYTPLKPAQALDIFIPKASNPTFQRSLLPALMPFSRIPSWEKDLVPLGSVHGCSEKSDGHLPMFVSPTRLHSA